jgi:hypothetical protein
MRHFVAACGLALQFCVVFPVVAFAGILEGSFSGVITSGMDVIGLFGPANTSLSGPLSGRIKIDTDRLAPDSCYHYELRGCFGPENANPPAISIIYEINQ